MSTESFIFSLGSIAFLGENVVARALFNLRLGCQPVERKLTHLPTIADVGAQALDRREDVRSG